MKQISAFLQAVIMLFAMSALLFSACGNTQSEQSSLSDKSSQGTVQGQGTESNGSSSVESKKILIAYFSWAENAVQEDIDAMTSPSVSAPGNVVQLASWIQEETGGDLFSIKVSTPYPADWDGCLNRANKEKADDVHPALSNTLDTIADYDVVFLGYPNWWYSCPMAIYSFLDEHDLSGKQVYLFCSHGTGGLASSVKDIAAQLPSDADLSDNVFHVYQNDTPSAKEDVLNWLKELQYLVYQ